MKVFHNPAIKKIYDISFHATPENIRTATQERYAEWIHSCAEAWCIRSNIAHKETDVLHDWFPTFYQGFPTKWEIQNAGGCKAIKDRIRQGGLSISEELRPWTSDFLTGLKLSGAIRPDSCRREGRYQIWIPSHSELVEDLRNGHQFPKRLITYPGTPHILRISCCPVLLLPAEDNMGTDVMAGLFAGSTMIETDGERWMSLPATSEVCRLLKDWSIIHRSAIIKHRPRLHVSPFYAALFASNMPPALATRTLNVKKSALCPLLPQIYWDMVLAREGMPIIPFPTALPFGCAIRTYRRRGWDRKELHREAVTRLGISHVAIPLKIQMLRWFEEANTRRMKDACAKDFNRLPGGRATSPEEWSSTPHRLKALGPGGDH